MRKKSTRLIDVVKHFQSLLVVMTGTVVAALLLPLFLRFVMAGVFESGFVEHLTGDEQGNPAAALLHFLCGLSFLQGVAICLVPCAIITLPFACAAYRKGCEEVVQF